MTAIVASGEQHDKTCKPDNSAAASPLVGTKEWRDQQALIQHELDECLDELATPKARKDEDIARIVERLNTVYSNKGFRHRYSEIIGVVHKFDEEDDLSVDVKASRAVERGNSLADGLRVFLTHDCSEACGPDCPTRKLQQEPRFMKLYDHANLEAKRAGYEQGRILGTTSLLKDAQQALAATQEELKRTQSELESAKADLEKANEQSTEASAKAERLQTETISTLGVFSAIVLAFNASITFSTSSIAAVDTTPPFNIAFVVSIVGFMLFNCLYAAFAFIFRVLNSSKELKWMLSPKLIAGIELIWIAVIGLFGCLAYTYGMAQWPCVAIAFVVASIGVLFRGIECIRDSGAL